MNRNQFGITLMEVILYIGLTAFLLTGVMAITFAVLKTGSQGGARSQVESSFAFTAERIREDVQDATDIVTVTPDQLTIKVNGFATTYSRSGSPGVVYRQIEGNPSWQLTPTTVDVTQTNFGKVAGKNLDSITFSLSGKSTTQAGSSYTIQGAVMRRP